MDLSEQCTKHMGTSLFIRYICKHGKTAEEEGCGGGGQWRRIVEDIGGLGGLWSDEEEEDCGWLRRREDCVCRREDCGGGSIQNNTNEYR